VWVYHKLVITARTGLAKPARTKTQKLKCRLMNFNKDGRKPKVPYPNMIARFPPKHDCGSQTLCLVPSLGCPTSVSREFGDSGTDQGKMTTYKLQREGGGGERERVLYEELIAVWRNGIPASRQLLALVRKNKNNNTSFIMT